MTDLAGSLLRRAIRRARWSIDSHRVRRAHPVRAVPPCYFVLERFADGDTIVDIGLGTDADFSSAMLERFPVRSVGFDPTRKHHHNLIAIESSSQGRFRLIRDGLGPRRETATFYESSINVSGSVLTTHPNIVSDPTSSYDVQLQTLADVVEASGGSPMLVKLDVEGLEYDVFDASGDETLLRSPQWVVEFHHDIVPPYSFKDTIRVVKRFSGLGFRAFSRDAVNFLFFLP